MTFTAGTKLGTYEIVGPLGAGGMGEVYRARDLRLKREVAIKVLPDAFSRDAQRVARFQREAEVLASLNHPLIAAIYDLAKSGESQFIVLELVEGETLAERIARGPIPLDDALQIAKQIAEGLEAAHEKAIIHRDLKPANVKLTPEGKVKVLDFGLAKVREIEDPGAGLSNTPTFVTGASTPGAILGTALYMSPEQTKGRETDRTSDVWAFGCVLYEMLTGRRTFDGESVSEVFAAILKEEPDWNSLPADTPENVRRLLRRCLNKNRGLRLQHLGDARIEIEEPDRPNPVAPAPKRPNRIAVVSALALVTILVLGAGLWMRRPASPAPEIRLDVTMPPGTSGTNPASFAISPDGQTIVFTATSEGTGQLWLRSLDSLSARPMERTEGATNPFWSPDSGSIAFFADGKLRRIDLDTGSVQNLADAPAGRGGDWNVDGVIVFPPTNSGPLFRVQATGGELVAVTELAPQQANHRHPQFLPDGEHFLYYATGDPEVRGIYVGQLDGRASPRVLDSEAAAVYAPPDQLLFVRDGTLLTQDFDVTGLELIGNPSQVVESVLVDGANRAAVSASAAGSFVFRSGSGSDAERELVWFDRSGNEIERVGDGATNSVAIALSPDGRYVALQRSLNGNVEIDLLDLARNLTLPFTRGAGTDRNPIWSPDGTRVVFDSNLKGAYDLYEKSMTGVGGEQVLFSTPRAKTASDWSPEGFILYRSNEPNAANDIWALPYDRNEKEFPVVQTNFDEANGQFAPEGKWIAYDSNETGRREIWVQQFPGPGGKTRISSDGGGQPRWRKDGRELFYIGLDDRLMAVSIRISSDGQTIDAAPPVPLFDSRLARRAQGIAWQYAVSPDGQRFLVNTVVRESASPITAILNWNPKP